MTIITRQDCPKIKPRYDEPQPIAKGKIRQTTYRAMIHRLTLQLDREPTDSECYKFLCEVQNG